jgi:hypothetical protein
VPCQGSLSSCGIPAHAGSETHQHCWLPEDALRHDGRCAYLQTYGWRLGQGPPAWAVLPYSQRCLQGGHWLHGGLRNRASEKAAAHHVVAMGSDMIVFLRAAAFMVFSMFLLPKLKVGGRLSVIACVQYNCQVAASHNQSVALSCKPACCPGHSVCASRGVPLGMRPCTGKRVMHSSPPAEHAILCTWQVDPEEYQQVMQQMGDSGSGNARRDGRRD